jgi:hypothetical protein
MSSAESAGGQSEALTFNGRVVAASTDHIGELDVLQIGITQLDSNGSMMDEESVRITVESASGVVLSSEPLGLGELRRAASQEPADTVQVQERPFELQVPQSLLKDGDFRANLFVCIDTNGDRACGDQLAAELMGDSGLETQQVVAFVPMVLSYQDDLTVEARQLRPGEEGYGVAARSMEVRLKNYDPAAFGVDLSEDVAIVLSAATSVVGVVPEGEETPPEEEYCDLDDCIDIILESPTNVEEYLACMGQCDIMHRDEGCFTMGTRIAVDQGRWLTVERLRPGTMVLTQDGRRLPVVRAVSGPEKAPIVRIKTAEAHELGVTQDHPMLTSAGLKLASRLRLGDELIVAKGQSTSVVALSSENVELPVFNVELKGSNTADHLLVAEGLVTGDLHIQEDMSVPKLLSAQR